MQIKYLQYTTRREKKIINEALTIKNQQDARRKGWKRIGSGLYKVGYYKQGIVVKLKQHYSSSPPMDDLDYYLSVSKYRRKYLARIFAVSDKHIVQKFASHKGWTNKNCKIAHRICDLLGIDDGWPPENRDDGAHNMGIIKGKPVFYDFNCE